MVPEGGSVAEPEEECVAAPEGGSVTEPEGITDVEPEKDRLLRRRGQ